MSSIYLRKISGILELKNLHMGTTDWTGTGYGQAEGRLMRLRQLRVYMEALLDKNITIGAMPRE